MDSQTNSLDEFISQTIEETAQLNNNNIFEQAKAVLKGYSLTTDNAKLKMIAWDKE